jgi:hypothetical protein
MSGKGNIHTDEQHKNKKKMTNVSATGSAGDEYVQGYGHISLVCTKMVHFGMKNENIMCSNNASVPSSMKVSWVRCHRPSYNKVETPLVVLLKKHTFNYQSVVL